MDQFLMSIVSIDIRVSVRCVSVYNNGATRTAAVTGCKHYDKRDGAMLTKVDNLLIPLSTDIIILTGCLA